MKSTLHYSLLQSIPDQLQKELKKAETFSAGTLAKLFNISKQALYYYERIGLLLPEFVAANGFRQYSVDQYLQLEIITTLRRLDIPVADIQHFMTHKSLETLQALLAEHQSFCQKEIERYTAISQELQSIQKSFATAQSHRLNRITLEWHESQPLLVTPIKKTYKDSTRLSLYGRHATSLMNCGVYYDVQTGWLADSSLFLSSEPKLRTTGYFSKLPSTTLPTTTKFSPINTSTIAANTTATPSPLIQEASYFISLYFTGTAYRQAPKLAQKLSRFIKLNSLTINGPLYFKPLINHWITDTTTEFITQISVPVLYEEN